MIIRIVATKKVDDIQNNFPEEASTNLFLSYIIYSVLFGVMAVFGLVASSNTPEAGMVLLVPIIGAIFVISFGYWNSHGGDNFDIEMNQGQDLVKVGEEKRIKLTGARFVYHSERYNNPTTRSIFDGEIMVVGIYTANDGHTFKMRMNE